MSRPDPAFWRNKRVLLTGHTGFKGGWVALWLHEMGAEVHGLALAPDTDPSLHALANVDTAVAGAIGDIRDRATLEATIARARPQIVLHLAAAGAPFGARTDRDLRRQRDGHGALA